MAKTTKATEKVEVKKTTLNIERSQVAAVALAAAKGDVRYYLNGVKFECLDGGKVAAIATDGHRLHAGIVGTWEGDKQDFILAIEHTDMLTKRMVVKRSVTTGAAEVTAVTTTTRRPNPDYNPATTESPFKEIVTSTQKITFPYKDIEATVKPIEGTYPDWRRVCKKTEWGTGDKKADLQQWTSSDIVNKHVFINPTYQLDVVKAFALYRNGRQSLRKGEEAPYISDVATFGDDKAVIYTTNNSEFFALVMPVRSGSVALNMPEWVFSETAGAEA